MARTQYHWKIDWLLGSVIHSLVYHTLHTLQTWTGSTNKSFLLPWIYSAIVFPKISIINWPDVRPRLWTGRPHFSSCAGGWEITRTTRFALFPPTASCMVQSEILWRSQSPLECMWKDVPAENTDSYRQVLLLLLLGLASIWATLCIQNIQKSLMKTFILSVV